MPETDKKESPLEAAAQAAAKILNDLRDEQQALMDKCTTEVTDLISQISKETDLEKCQQLRDRKDELSWSHGIYLKNAAALWESAKDALLTSLSDTDKARRVIENTSDKPAVPLRLPPEAPVAVKKPEPVPEPATIPAIDTPDVREYEGPPKDKPSVVRRASDKFGVDKKTGRRPRRTPANGASTK